MNVILSEIANAVLDGEAKNIVLLCQKAVAENVPVADILKKGLIAGMNEVGILFKEGEMFVPEVLVSAKTLQYGVDYLSPYLKEAGVEVSGKIITVTVEGDLHDIGIKLVGMMLEGAGFEVINLGVDRKAADIIAKVKELKPDILAMSAMLTTTMGKMEEVIALLKQEGLYDQLHVMVGGAPLSPLYAGKIQAHYSADASSAVTIAKELLNVA
ncbi:MAG: corrinoid protein [Cloacibacillus sp.]